MEFTDINDRWGNIQHALTVLLDIRPWVSTSAHGPGVLYIG